MLRAAQTGAWVFSFLRCSQDFVRLTTPRTKTCPWGPRAADFILGYFRGIHTGMLLPLRGRGPFRFSRRL
jgi:hypothetical protein